MRKNFRSKDGITPGFRMLHSSGSVQMAKFWIQPLWSGPTVASIHKCIQCAHFRRFLNHRWAIALDSVPSCFKGWNQAMKWLWPFEFWDAWITMIVTWFGFYFFFSLDLIHYIEYLEKKRKQSVENSHFNVSISVSGSNKLCRWSDNKQSSSTNRTW